MRINLKALVPWAGMVFIAAAIATGFLFFTQPSKDYVKTEATTADVEEIYDTDAEGMATTSYNYFVDYIVDGASYTHVPLGYSEPSFEVGKIVEIYYNPAQPSVIVADTGSMMVYTGIVAGVSLVVFLVGFIVSRQR